MAQFDVDEKSAAHESLDQVLKADKRASDLVSQILTFSRHSKHETKTIHLNPLIKEALKMLRSTIPTSIALRDLIHTSLLTVKADPTHIHQVIVNLVANAAQAVDADSGSIKINLAPIDIKANGEEKRNGVKPGSYGRLTVPILPLMQNKRVLY